MRYLVTTLRGLEPIVLLELREILGVRGKIVTPGRVLFSCTNVDSFILKARSVIRLYTFFDCFHFTSKKDILDHVKKISPSFINDDFVVRCFRQGNHRFNSNDIESPVGGIFFRNGKRVNLSSSTVFVVDIVDNFCSLGLLVANQMDKRSYRVRPFSGGTIPILAYALIRFCEVSPEDSVVDPTCYDGVLAIEASLFGCSTVFGFSSSKHFISSATIHSRLAKSDTSFSVRGLDWLDTSFLTGEVSFALSFLPYPRRRVSSLEASEYLSQFFSQVSFVVSKGVGVIVFDPSFVCPIAINGGFYLKKSSAVFHGARTYHFLFFVKGSKTIKKPSFSKK